MINKLSSKNEKTGASRFITSVVVIGTALLILLKPGVSTANNEVQDEIFQLLKKYPDKEYTIQENQTNTETYSFNQTPNTINGDNDALSYASTNVSKYYPDMKDHLTTMINSFRDQEHKNATIHLLNKMVSNISNPEQKVGATISALERSVFNKGLFAKKYDEKITDETFKYIEIFDAEYKARFKGYYARLEASIETKKNTLKQKQDNLKQGCQEIEAIMDKFSPNQVKTSESIRKLVIQTQELFISSGYIFSPHTKTLFEALN